VQNIIVAIDGFAACGKSTTAKRVAQRLGYLYIDTGAMYRAVTLAFLRQGISFEEETPEMLEALNKLSVRFSLDDPESPQILLNEEAVEDQIRTPEVSDAVSLVSKHPSVRHAMVREQRKMGENKGIVMDGRDIGTYVFPHAELKIFLVADMEIRAYRRQLQYEKKGIRMTLNDIIKNLEERDFIDTNREIAPLKKAKDAITIDTSYISFQEQVQQVYHLAMTCLVV